MYFLCRRTNGLCGLAVVIDDDWSVVHESKIDSFDVRETKAGFGIFIRCNNLLYSIEKDSGNSISDYMFDTLEGALKALTATFKL